MRDFAEEGVSDSDGMLVVVSKEEESGLEGRYLYLEEGSDEGLGGERGLDLSVW